MSLIEDVLQKHANDRAAAIRELAAIRDRQMKAIEVATTAVQRLGGAIEVLEALSVAAPADK